MPSVAISSSSVSHDSPLSMREICKICYKTNPIGFKVPDDIWEAVVPAHLETRVVGLWCFVHLADAKMIPWAHNIEFFPVSLYDCVCQEKKEN